MAQAIVIRDDVPLAEYIELAASPEFQAAGTWLTSDGNFGCSGVLVASDKVLTAAHCVDFEETPLSPDARPETIMFGIGPSVAELGPFVNNVASVAVHPNWTQDVVTTPADASFDVAVLTLSTPILDVAPARVTAANPAGRLGTLVGYGGQGLGSGTAEFLPGAPDRLAAQNIIDFVETLPGEPAVIETDFDSPAVDTNTLGSPQPVRLEGTTAGGDSGGPLFASFGDEVFVTGILNGGFNPFGEPTSYGDISAWAFLGSPANVAFLESQGVPIFAIPEPASGGLLAATCMAACLRRRRLP